MINRTMFALILCFCSSIISAMAGKNDTKSLAPTASVPPSNGGTNVYVQVTPSFHNAAVAENTNTNVTEVHTTVKNAIDMMQKTINNIPHDVQGWFDSHKWHLAIGTPIATYALICSFLLYGNRHMHDETTWIHWKRHLSLEELNAYCLKEQQKEDLSNNLIDAILKRYFKTKDPMNHIDPLIQFTNDIEQEINFISRYIVIATVIQKSQLIKIFPTNDTKVAQAKECRQRLQFIKRLFINSMATYNLNQFLTAAKPSIASSAPIVMPVPVVPEMVVPVPPIPVAPAA